MQIKQKSNLSFCVNYYYGAITLEEIVPVHPVEEIVILITVNLGRVKKSDIILLVARIKLICGYLQWHSTVFKTKV